MWFVLQGGLKAVIWVDAFQALVMLAGLLAISIKVCHVTGMLSDVMTSVLLEKVVKDSILF